MRTKIAFVTSLAALGALLPAAALAQDAPAAAAPAPAPAAAPAAAPAEAAPAAAPAAPAAAPAVEAAPAAEAAPTAEVAPTAPAAEVTAAADAPAAMPGWIRIDSDASALQMWGGFTYPLADGIGLAFDMYVNSGFLGELDIGPAITAGPLTLTPMLGLQIDWLSRRAQALVPQFYAVGSLGPIYTELWFQYYLNSVFLEDAPNQIFVRLIADFKINDNVAAGLELDLAHDNKAIDHLSPTGDEAGLRSLAIGPNVLFSNAGAASSFMIFLGYETQGWYANGGALPPNDESQNHLTGRLTFVHNF